MGHTKQVRGRAGATKADRRRNELTLATVQGVPESTRLFKSLGTSVGLLSVDWLMD